MSSDVLPRASAHVIPGRCVHCHRPMPKEGPSDDFCREDCQKAWTVLAMERLRATKPGRDKVNDRPDYLGPPYAEVYDWLADNGIREWLPEQPNVWIAGGNLTYESWVWDGPRGFDMAHISRRLPATTTRTVPLVAPPTERIRNLAVASGIQWHEEGDVPG